MRLGGYGRWFQQLWAESLGKVQSNGVSMGTLPVPCVGANDQHSLLQLFVEGPAYSTYSFITVLNWPEALDPVFECPSDFSKLKYANGYRMSEILNAEASATAQSLALKERPVFELQLPELNAETLGALYAFSMDWTVVSACLKQINPFDQEGVEQGKRILQKILAS
jgi:glucose-6-phosphate isomerase